MMQIYFEIKHINLKMGQKAKNAGKKQSRTCDKLATAKSLRYNGKGMKMTSALYIDIMNNPEILDEKLAKQIGKNKATRYKQFFVVENTDYNKQFT